jgi:hypothetical protein
MVDANNSAVGSAPAGRGGWGPLFGLLPALPYLALIVLALIGVSWTSISSAPSTTYWVMLTPVAAFICIAAGWSGASARGEGARMITTQILQWTAVLVAMWLVNVSDMHRLLSVDAKAPILLTLIALGVFISGLYLRAWKLCVVAAFLAVAVPIVAWVEQAALLLLIIAGGLITLGLAGWWAKGGGAGTDALVPRR